MAITYAPTTNFGLKDSLPTNDSDKVIRGSEFTTEFTAIQTAFSLAAPTASPTFTGTVTIPTADINGGNIDGTVIGAATPAAGSFTTGQFGTSLNVDGTVTADGLTVDTNTLHVDAVNNRVGIGTPSPSNDLHITGTSGTKALFERTGSTGAYIGLKDSSGSLVYLGDNNGTFEVQTAGSSYSTKLAVTSSGNVGIGTTSPAASLHVVSGATTTALIQSSAVATTLAINNTHANAWGSNLAIRTGGVDSGYFGTIGSLLGSTSQDLTVYATAGNGFRVYTNGNNERMRIDSSGRVGIGTSSPATPLDVTTAGGGDFVATFQNTTAATPYGVSIKEPASAANGYPSFQITDSAGTSVRLRVDSGTGNVGIGTTSAGRLLHVSAASGDTPVRIQTATTGAFIEFQDAGTTVGRRPLIGANGDNLVFYTSAGSYSERMRIDSSGRLLLGTTSNYGGEALQIDANSVGSTVYTAYISNTNTSTSAYNVMRWAQGAAGSATGMIGTGGSAASNAAFRDSFVVGTQSSSPLVFATADAERARIDSSGVLLVGATAADGIGGAPGDINNAEIGKGYINLNRDDTATARQIQFGKNGVVAGYIETGSSTTSYVTSSDARLKENIADAEDASSLVDAIKVRQFDWKADGSHQRYGMVAQELLEVAPEAVSQGATEDDMMGVDYSKLVPMLVKEIQSLRARVAQLEGA